LSGSTRPFLLEPASNLLSFCLSFLQIPSAWEKYKRMADVITRGGEADLERFGGDKHSAAGLEKLLTTLDRTVMCGNVLRTALDSPIELALMQAIPGGEGNMAGLTGFKELLLFRTMDNIDFLLGTIGSDLETNESYKLVGQLCLYALYRTLTSRMMPDPKVFERLWKILFEKVPLLHLHSKHVLLPDAFLMEFAPMPHNLDPKKLVPRDPHSHRDAVAEKHADSLPSIVGVIYNRTISWLVKAATTLAPHPLAGFTGHSGAVVAELLKNRLLAVTQALCLASQAQRHLHLFLCYTLLLRRDVRKRAVDPLAKLLELLKALEGGVKSYSASIAETLPHVQRENVREVLNRMLPLRLKIAASRGAESAPARTLSAAVDLVESLAITTESWSPLRRIFFELGVSVGLQKAGVSRDQDVAAVVRSCWLLEQASDYQQRMRKACDCSTLYWARELLPVLTECAACLNGSSTGIPVDPRQGARLQFLFTAFSDAAEMLAKGVEHLPPPPPPAIRLAVAAGSETIKPSLNPDSPFAGIQHILESYEVLLHGILRHDVILPLCRLVENDLRVHVHAVHLSHMEPPSLRSNPGKPPLVHLLSLPPIRIFGALVDIKEEVTHYLEKQFYELSTVALHDWKTYGEMASVAADKYGLKLTDNRLPMGCLDAGTDVLEIMRHLHVFVGRFNYNLNQQFFIEKRTLKGGKHVNVVTLHSISSSIRQHGSGMMNTTVNFAYQFLAKKFYIFSQFLFDEYIKSHLMKERRFFRRERKALDNRYPYEHAIDLTRDIRKLGLTDDRQSYLDKFRSLISEIGNALGYVRLVRSAGMNAAAEAIKFVPDLNLITGRRTAGVAEDVDANEGRPDYEDEEEEEEENVEEAAASADGTKKVVTKKKRKGFSFEEAARGVRVRNVITNPDGTTSVELGPGLSEESIEAARNLDLVLANLVSNFSEGVDYFTLLVSVFQHVLLRTEQKSSAPAAPAPDAPPAAGAGAGAAGDAASASGGATPAAGAAPADGASASSAAPAAAAPAPAAAPKVRKKEENHHLRNFFLIVPSLCLSFVENLRTAKDRMEKAVKGSEAFFTDDGFALGIAYILAILKQDKAFESLHWWDSVNRYHASELAKVDVEWRAVANSKSKADADKREELDFRRKRILAESKEFEALYYSYRGSRTFFRDAHGTVAGADDDDDDALAAMV
jgi:WASH complex subunit 7/WASH complex subunit 7, C-terminal/WASH complex subunit 7, N-terminal